MPEKPPLYIKINLMKINACGIIIQEERNEKH